MIGHQRNRDRRDILGQLMLQMRAVGDMDLAHAGDLRGGLGNAIDALARDQQVDIAKLRSGGDGGERRVLDVAAFMFDEDQRLHFATPRLFSFATSSSTEPTFTPAWRLAGSTTFSVSRRGATSTPKSPGDLTLSGFDLAFMMLGSEA